MSNIHICEKCGSKKDRLCKIKKENTCLDCSSILLEDTINKIVEKSINKYREVLLWKDSQKTKEEIQNDRLRELLQGEIISLTYNYVYPEILCKDFVLKANQIKDIKIKFPDGSELITDTNIKTECIPDGNCTHTVDRLFVRDSCRGREIEYSLEDLLKEGLEIRLF